MARRTANGISGSAGNLVFYIMDGGEYVRMKPGKRKKKRGHVPHPGQAAFGAVSKYGSAMARFINRDILFPFGRYGYNQLRGWMWNQYMAFAHEPDWGLAAKGGITCGLNREADLRDFFVPALQITDNGGGVVDIHIPSFNPKKEIAAPRHTIRVNMKLLMSSSPFAENAGSIDNVWMEQYGFEHADTVLPAKTISINSSTPHLPTGGHIAIIVMALEFEGPEKGRRTYHTEKQWLPASVIAMGRLKA
ncbi:MAG TPA: hypothetical protein VK484_04155 [Ferruginibacter sp.]|nr:hypothetical protein [Ferruginibacter sp.]